MATVTVGGVELTEIIRDTVANLLVQGTNVTLVVSDEADTITISAGSGGESPPITEENVQDIVGALIVSGSNVSIAYSDDSVPPTLTISVDLSSVANVNSDWNSTSGISEILNKPTSISGYGITDAYTKTEIDNKISAVYKYKGSVANYSSLPTADLVIGDVYNVTDSGINYAWTGTIWDDIGGIEALATATNNGLMTKEDFSKLANIEVGAEANNISDIDATSLTGAGDSSLHYHSADRNRSNHSGNQLASTISDFVATVRNTVLTGLSMAASDAITTADSILSALGKLQAQITAIQGSLTGGIVIVRGTGTLPITGWATVTGDYTNRYDYAIAGVTIDDCIEVIPDKDAQDIAQTAEVCQTCEIYDGGIYIYCKTVPTGEIPFQYTILR